MQKHPKITKNMERICSLYLKTSFSSNFKSPVEFESPHHEIGQDFIVFHKTCLVGRTELTLKNFFDVEKEARTDQRGVNPFDHNSRTKFI